MTFAKRIRREPMGLRDPEGGRYRSQQYRAWVRGFECCIAGKLDHVCVVTRSAAHVRIGTDGCKDVKPSDWWTIPLCDNYLGGGAPGGEQRARWFCQFDVGDLGNTNKRSSADVILKRIFARWNTYSSFLAAFGYGSALRFCS